MCHLKKQGRLLETRSAPLAGSDSIFRANLCVLWSIQAGELELKDILRSAHLLPHALLTMGEQAVHLSKARLAGRTLSNLERKPRICGGGINNVKMWHGTEQQHSTQQRAFYKPCLGQLGTLLIQITWSTTKRVNSATSIRFLSPLILLPIFHITKKKHVSPLQQILM